MMENIWTFLALSFASLASFMLGAFVSAMRERSLAKARKLAEKEKNRKVEACEKVIDWVVTFNGTFLSEETFKIVVLTLENAIGSEFDKAKFVKIAQNPIPIGELYSGEAEYSKTKILQLIHGVKTNFKSNL